MRGTEFKALLVIFGSIVGAWILAAAIAHRPIVVVGELFGGLAMGTLVFLGYRAFVEHRARSWDRAPAAIEDVTVDYGQGKGARVWHAVVAYAFTPANSADGARVHGKETLMFKSEERAEAIRVAARSGRRILVEYDPRSPTLSRLVTEREDPVFDT